MVKGVSKFLCFSLPQAFEDSNKGLRSYSLGNRAEMQNSKMRLPVTFSFFVLLSFPVTEKAMYIQEYLHG